jgi:chloramphenicol O-acetyltransferase type A
MKIIDVENWERKSQFLNFSKYTHPVFSVGVRLKVTNLVSYCHNNNYSFFPAFLYIVSKCSNQIPEMKTRIENGKVVQHDIIHPSYVILRNDNCIATCLTEFGDDFTDFYSRTKKSIGVIKQDERTLDFNSHIRTDCLYISSMQWIDLSMSSNPYNFEDLEQTSIPRITWGKYVEQSDGSYEMGFNVSVHHGFMDGVHVAQFINGIEKALENIESFLGDVNER